MTTAYSRIDRFLRENLNDNDYPAYKEELDALCQAKLQRTWVGLEGEEIRNSWEEATKPDRSTMTMITSFARAIEAKLKDKNCVG